MKTIKEQQKFIQEIIDFAYNDLSNQESDNKARDGNYPVDESEKKLNAIAPLLKAAPEMYELLESLLYLGERLEQESGETDPIVSKTRKLLKSLKKTNL